MSGMAWQALRHGSLRAFAPSREANFLFSSREDAKTRRHLSAADVLRLLGHNMPPVEG